MSVRLRTRAAVGAAIAILVSGCSGGGGQLPTLQQQENLPQNLRHAYQNVSSIDPNLSPTCTWSIVPSTSPVNGFQDLYAVDAASNSEAWAVGEGSKYRTLALHWNGSTWKQYVTPNPVTLAGNDVNFKAVSETAPNDVWAIGNYEDSSYIVHTLAEHWDGVQWKIVPTPATPPGDTGFGLWAMKMISHDNGWAAGSEYVAGSAKTLIEHRNGSTWTRVPSPNATLSLNELNSLAVVSPTDIWASGGSSNGTSVVLHYDGTQWTLSHTIVAEVDALAAASSTEVFDVGYYPNSTQTYAEKYDGSSWTPQVTPNAGSDNVSISGAAAVSAKEVFAVGYHQTGTTNDAKPFAMMWNGTSWVASPPRARNASYLNAITAIPGTKDAFAVGFSRDYSNGTDQLLIERVHCL